jgi:cell division septum initiation protein DivIVA
MTTDNPDVLRHEIESTQRTITADVDALTEKVTPGRIVRRRTDRVRQRINSLRDKVMGGASDVIDTATHQASTVADAVGEAPQAIRRGTEGNPLAAGLVAFGLGWLAASLLPATKAEQQAAQQAKELVSEHSDQIGQVAEQVKDSLGEPAHQAVDAVRSTVQDAAQHVTEHVQDTGHP